MALGISLLDAGKRGLDDFDYVRLYYPARFSLETLIFVRPSPGYLLEKLLIVIV